MDKNNNKVISVKGLTKQFGTFTAVDHITFDVERGGDFRFPRRERSGKDHSHAYVVRFEFPDSRQRTGGRI